MDIKPQEKKKDPLLKNIKKIRIFQIITIE